MLAAEALEKCFELQLTMVKSYNVISLSVLYLDFFPSPGLVADRGYAGRDRDRCNYA
jgi:hypothetical protein